MSDRNIMVLKGTANLKKKKSFKNEILLALVNKALKLS